MIYLSIVVFRARMEDKRCLGVMIICMESCLRETTCEGIRMCRLGHEPGRSLDFSLHSIGESCRML